jgi:hypothetical protein
MNTNQTSIKSGNENTRTRKPFAQGNFTVFDNYILDEIMPDLSGSAWKVLTVVIRQTVGWVAKDAKTVRDRKKWDWISYSQFRKKTGIASDATVSKALKECLAANYILRHVEGSGQAARYYYSLNEEYEITEPSLETKEIPSLETKETNRNPIKENNTMPVGKEELPKEELIPVGEEFSSSGQTRKIKISSPGPRITPLSPSTPGAEFMFAEVAKESIKGITFYVNKCAQNGVTEMKDSKPIIYMNSRPPPTSINPGG